MYPCLSFRRQRYNFIAEVVKETSAALVYIEIKVFFIILLLNLIPAQGQILCISIILSVYLPPPF